MSSSAMKTGLKTLVIASLLWAGIAAGAGRFVTEVITLSGRSADEMVQVLRPLVPPPGTVVAFYDKLVVKTTASNLDEVKRVLAQLDRRPRNLLISVKRGIVGESERDAASVFGRIRRNDVTVTTRPRTTQGGGAVIIGEPGGSGVGVRAQTSRTHDDEHNVQQIRVMEGGEAFINAGRSVPFVDQDVTVYSDGTSVREYVRLEDVGTGFYVRPRLNGDRVTLDISPHRSRLNRSDTGSIDYQAAHTTVSGRLGEWIAIGGGKEQRRQRQSGVLSTERSSDTSDRTIMVKVEALD